MREQYKSYIVIFLFMSLMVLLAASCNKYVDDEIIPVFNPNWKPIPSEIDQDIPVVYITTEKGAAITSKEEYVRGYISISDKKGRYSEVKLLESPMGIRGRGNTTWKYDKKPYKIKLDEKQKVLGMDKNKDWVLLANYCDKSLMRNIVAMEISRKLEFSWTIDMIPVEVYINDVYQGVYNICQHKEVANHRVEIAEDELLFELDKSMDEPVHFRSEVCKIPVNFSHPELPSAEVTKYAKDYFRDFETALYSDDFASPEKGYAKYIDVDSFIKYYIIQELSYNIDGKCCKSTFLTKQKDKKMEMYFVWDFDLAFGNCNYFGKYYNLDNGPTGFHTRDYLSDYTSGGVNYGNYGKGWYFRLFQDPAFVAKVKAKWNEIYPFLQTVPKLIDDHVKAIGEDPINRNFEKWQILGKYTWPQTTPYPETHAGEVQKLKEFYSARLKWLNEELNRL